MKHTKTFIFILSLCLLCGCGGTPKKLASLAEKVKSYAGYEDEDVNAVQQALPTIMILPSDKLLKDNRCLDEVEYDGKTFTLRDYRKFLAKGTNFRRIISTIQDAFVKDNYPITDFEQAVKNLNTNDAYAIADNLERDAKTMLLQTCHPDIILELDYSANGGSVISHDYGNSKKKISYTISAIDAYSSKIESSVSAIGLEGESEEAIFNESLEDKMPKLKEDIMNYFSDIIYRGREVNIKFVVASNGNIKLSQNNIEGDTYSDWLIDFVKTHTVKGAYRMQNNSDYELSFVNARIKLLNEDGTQYGVYDWARDCIKKLNTQLGLNATNASQGLGEIVININGY